MGGKGGKGGSISTPNINLQPSPYEARMADIANEYYQSTSPLRNTFLASFGSFMQPPTSQPTSGGGGGGMGTTTTTTQGSGSTPFSQNFLQTQLPSTDDIYNSLRIVGTAGGITEGDKSQAWSALTPLGLTSFPVSSQDVYGQESPEYLASLRQQAGDLRLNAMQQAANQGMQQIASQQTTTGQVPQAGGPSNFTNQNLYNPYNLPAFAPLYQLARGGIESQYNPARENIMASTPRGGALYENLANLEMSRAQQAGSLPAQIAAPLIQDIYNKAYGVAFGAPQTTLSGLGGAESGYSSRYNTASSLASNAAMQQSALNQQSSMGLGAGLGSLLGFGLKSGSKLWG